MSDNVCKFCGATQQGDHYHLYQCGSWICASGAVVQSNTCRHRCLQIRVQHEQTIEAMRQRIAAAKQRLESLNGKQVGQAELYAVIEILEGKE